MLFVGASLLAKNDDTGLLNARICDVFTSPSLAPTTTAPSPNP